MSEVLILALGGCVTSSLFFYMFLKHVQDEPKRMHALAKELSYLFKSPNSLDAAQATGYVAQSQANAEAMVTEAQAKAERPGRPEAEPLGPHPLMPGTVLCDVDGKPSMEVLG